MFDKYYKAETCFSQEDVVAYLYNEISGTLRENFDRHLADCQTCIDEFASLSFSRFSVYEWQKLGFAHLETPEIVGPWQNVPQPLASCTSNVEAPGLAERLKEAVSAIFRQPAYILGPAMATVLVSVGMGVYLSLPGAEKSTPAAQPLAKVEAPPHSSVVAAGNEAEPSDTEITQVSAVHAGTKHTSVPTERVISAPKIVRAVKTAPARHSINTEMAAVVPATPRKAPRLSDFGEDEESGVRLSDLIAAADR